MVDCLGKKFRARLIAPGVVDYYFASIFANVDVGVVAIEGVVDAADLLRGELRIGDAAVFRGRRQHRIPRASMPVDQIFGTSDVLFIAETEFVTMRSVAEFFEIEKVIPAVVKSQHVRGGVAVAAVYTFGRRDGPCVHVR